MNNSRSQWYNKVKNLRDSYLGLFRGKARKEANIKYFTGQQKTKKQPQIIPEFNITWNQSKEDLEGQYWDIRDLYVEREDEIAQQAQKQREARRAKQRQYYAKKNPEKVAKTQQKKEQKKTQRKEKQKAKEAKKLATQIRRQKKQQEKAYMTKVHKILVAKRKVNKTLGYITQQTRFNEEIHRTMKPDEFAQNKQKMFSLIEVEYLNNPDKESLFDNETPNHFDNKYGGLIHELEKVRLIINKIKNLKATGLHLKVAGIYNILFDLNGVNFHFVMMVVVTINCDRVFSKFLTSGDKIVLEDDIRNEIMLKFQSGENCIAVIEYSVISLTNDNYMDFNKHVKEMKAYQPMSNQQFHEMTACSTTKHRDCIYQSYCYMYKDPLSIKEKKCDEYLKKESEEIKKIVKEGSLYEFCRLKSIEHNETFNVEFFTPIVHTDETIYGFTVTGDKIKQINELMFFEEKRTFLYDQQHVAPRRFHRKEETSKQRRLFGMVRKELWADNKERYYREYGGDDAYEMARDEAEAEYKKRYNIGHQRVNNKTEYKITPTKPNGIDIDYVCAYDFETLAIDENGTQEPYCCCVKNPKEKGDKVFYGDNVVKSLCDYIDTIKTETYTSKTNPKTKIKQILIYGFNNSRFDNIFIFNELHNRNPATKYIIHNGYKYIKYFNVRFYDLNLYYSMKLSSTAQAFGLKISKDIYPYDFVKEQGKKCLNYKGKVPEAKYWVNGKNDYDEYIKENGEVFDMKAYTIKYCMKDSELTLEIAKKHLSQSVGQIWNVPNSYEIMTYDEEGDPCEEMGRAFDVRLCPTGAGIALKMFTQVFLPYILYNSPEKQQIKEREAYKGGRTEAFKKSFNAVATSRLKYIDINSSYPYAMTQMMCKKYVKTIFMEDKEEKEFVDHWLYNAKAEYIGDKKIVIANLLVKDQDGTIIAHPESKFSYHWGCELNEAVKNGFKVIINEINEYEGDTTFKGFAEYMYNERLKYKKTNPAKAEFYKLCMNSLYGKFGQKQMVNNKLCSTPEDINAIFSDVNTKVVDWEILKNEKILMKYSKLGDKFSIGSLVRFSSLIAAYARCNLSKMMRSLGWEHVYYCDTDSIFTDVEPPAEFISQTELGKWKLESSKKTGKPILITSANFLAPKLYNYKTDDGELCLKAKGQPQKELKEEFFTDLANGTKKEVSILNSAMFVRTLEDVKIIPQVRTMQEVYNKRKWEGNDSYAYKDFNEWKENKAKIDKLRTKKAQQKNKVKII